MVRWTMAKRAAFARKMKLARSRGKRARRKNPVGQKWYEVKVGGKLVWTAKYADDARFIAQIFAKKHPSKRVSVTKI